MPASDLVTCSGDWPRVHGKFQSELTPSMPQTQPPQRSNGKTQTLFFCQGGNGEFPEIKSSFDIQNIKCADI